MNPKHTRTATPRTPATTERRATDPSEEPSDARGVKPLTVNVPTDVLHRAKTRASLAGTTMSNVVTEALTVYADGLGQVLGDLGYTEKK